jgi:enediyne biosynthesis protein E4
VLVKRVKDSKLTRQLLVRLVWLIGASVAIAALVESVPASALQRVTHAPVRHPVFRDVAHAAGLDFIHINGASDERFFPEIMGSGGLFLDFDNDGWLDIFLIDGGSFADESVARRAGHRLYRNRGKGIFADVTAATGIRRRDYGMGACAGDFDNDGLIDLYITNVGPNVLYRNAGNGRFTEIPRAGGADAAMWSTSCAFVDVDRDGDLDLFVTNYVDWRRTNNQFCGISGPPPIRDYCHPLIYQPLTSLLYRNTGRRTFEDVSTHSGVARYRGNGLGVAVTDIDEDGWPDIFVANDNMPNFLFHNQRNGTFTEIAGLAGVSVASDGKARAGMGAAFADFAGNGRPGLIVTNLESEMHSLFVNLGNRLFSDVTVHSGVGPATRPYVGFGVAFLDYDNDTQLDIAIANGNVMANAGLMRAGAKYAQRNLLLRNAGRRFVNMKSEAGPGFAPEMVSRALAAGDIDNDGDLDLLITNNGAAANLLLNDGGSGNALLVRVIGTKSNADGIGATLTLTTGERRQRRDVQSGSSYLSQNDFRVHFGLGEADRADRLEVRWSSGLTDVIENLTANHVVTVREGRGVVSRVPLAR